MRWTSLGRELVSCKLGDVGMAGRDLDSIEAGEERGDETGEKKGRGVVRCERGERSGMLE